MSPENLLKPRYKVIADWPGNNCFIINDIFYEDDIRVNNKPRWTRLAFKFFPHLFKKLEWWEERKESDMPEYVKWSRGVYKVKNWRLSPEGQILVDLYNNEKGWFSTGGNYWMKNTNVLPATKEEYEKQIKLKMGAPKHPLKSKK